MRPSSRSKQVLHNEGEYGPENAGGSVLARRLLLGQAVQRAELPHEVDGMDTDHLAVGEQLGQCAQGHAVGGVVEGGHEHGVVGDVEIGVAGGQSESRWGQTSQVASWRSHSAGMRNPSSAGAETIFFTALI